MGKNISHLIIGGNEDDDDKSKNLIGALEILEHFGEKGKERGIVIVIGGHADLGMHVAHLLATTMSHHPVIFAQTNELGNTIISDDIIAKKPDSTIEDFIKQMGDDLKKRIAIMSNDIDTYEILKKSDITFKKEQEKMRRKYVNQKKVKVTKKQGR